MGDADIEQSTISVENVSDWTRKLSDVILVQRGRLLNLRSKAEIEEEELKLAALESLLREAIIAHQAKLNKDENTNSRSGDGAKQQLESLETFIDPEDNYKTTRQKLEQLKSRLRDAIIDQGARVRKLEGKPENNEAVKRLETLKADYKAATGKDWSEVRAEGPILLTTNAVTGREILPELRERLREHTRNGIIR